ncbi:MAG: hypothetical protein NC399_06390 [Muribaculum sp.]|nr:hypothetical protein [Muribaculum sp.]
MGNQYDAEVRVGVNMDNSDLQSAQKEFDRLTSRVEKLKAELEKAKGDGWSEQSDHWRRVSADVANTEAALGNVSCRMKELQGVKKVSDGFGEAKSAAERFHRTIQKGTGKARAAVKALGLTVGKLGAGLLALNLISKGFSAMVSVMQRGFRNLAQYSSDYNGAMSTLRSECVQLQNALAAAFEPIVTMAIPYISQLVNWLNRAIDAVGQFIAALTGKNTYTKAKKQVIDYAKAVDAAGKSAKKALAPFDELNVLSSNDASGSGDGEQTGADAFETVEIDEGIAAAAERLRSILEQLAPFVDDIALGFAAWKINEALGGGLIGLIGWIAILIGSVESVKNYLDMWENGVDWEGIQGYVKGVALVVGGLLIIFGPLVAGLALIAFGVAAVVLAIKDMNENGITAENVVLLIIGAVGILAGVFLAFGGTVTLVVAAVMAFVGIIAAVVAWAGSGEECLASLKAGFQALGDFFKHVFAGDFKAAFGDIYRVMSNFVNVQIAIFESFINVLIKGINWMIDKINSLLSNIKIPDWVPGIGGKEFSIELKKIPEVSLPRQKVPELADGAVIQGGRPFAAILGDQRFGQTNIEAPLDTIVEGVKTAMKEADGDASYTFVAQVDGRTIFRETVKRNQMHKKRTGKSAYA